MNEPLQRPRLLHLRSSTTGLPGFVRQHLAEQRRCLEQWFDVTVVEGSGDFRRLVETHEPDLCLLESGVYSRGLRLSGTDAHPDVLRLGFLHADAYCASRSTALADFARWQVRDVVSMSVSMADYTPALEGRVLCWPSSVDVDRFRGRGLDRGRTVTSTGSRAPHYPWRIELTARLAEEGVPTTSTPHGGWFDAASSAAMVVGDDYARLLASSAVVPACGTIARDLVRKHLEIPASGALLVAEPGAALSAAGFVDGVTCVTGDPATAASRIVELLDSPRELRSLAAAGTDLVVRRHTAAARRQVRDWYDVQRVDRGGPWHQPDPFGPVLPGAGGPAGPLRVDGRDRLLLADGCAALDAGRPREAEELFRRALAFHGGVEPLAGLAESRHRLGDHRGSADWAAQGVEHAVHVLSGDPDPVLVAMLVRAERATGAQRRAARLAGLAAPAGRPSLVVHPALVSGLPPGPDGGGEEPQRRRRPAGGRRPALRPLSRRVRVRWRSRAAGLLAGFSDVSAELDSMISRRRPGVVLLATDSLLRPAAAALQVAAATTPHPVEVWWVRGSGPRLTRLVVGGNGQGWQRGADLHADSPAGAAVLGRAELVVTSHASGAASARLGSPPHGVSVGPARTSGSLESVTA